jgi:hypothetical protein
VLGAGLFALIVASMAATSVAAQSTTGVAPSALYAAQDPVRQAYVALMQWRRDWENRDFERFSAHYAEAFQSTGIDRVAYLERKRIIFEKRPWQRIRINDVLWISEQGSPNAMSVRFVQEYDSPQGIDRSRKEQRWVRSIDRWQLSGETEVPLLEGDVSRTRTKSGAGGVAR